MLYLPLSGSTVKTKFPSKFQTATTQLKPAKVINLQSSTGSRGNWKKNKRDECLRKYITTICAILLLDSSTRVASQNIDYSRRNDTTTEAELSELSCHLGNFVPNWSDLLENFTRDRVSNTWPGLAHPNWCLTVWDPNRSCKTVNTETWVSTFFDIHLHLFSKTSMPRNEYPTPAIWAS